jgi:shikimate dehydrogenase
VSTHERSRLAVLGSPIAHSLSPRLHAAAYAQLGLDWTYESVELTGERLPAFLDDCDTAWRGLSLTMPLKRDVVPLLDTVDTTARLTGVVNTVRFDDSGRHGFNTDVAGIVWAFQQNGVPALSEVAVLGGGATAVSALVAASELGAQSVHFWVRTPAKASALRDVADALDLRILVSAFTDVDSALETPDAVISTLPNGSVVDLLVSREARARAVLFDVAYDPWPTSLATAWAEAGGRSISGLEMLINQALVQVRVFVTGDPDAALDDEDAVLSAMRNSVRAP